MNPEKGLVSVLIPAYNAEHYIAETIESVIQQTYPSWELIVVNDGSSDTTVEVVTRYLDDPRITLHTQKNAGVSAARNHAMSLAHGQYMAFLDADDLWEPTNLHRKVTVLQCDPSVNWVFSDMYILPDGDTKSRRLAPPGTDQDIVNAILRWDGEVVPGCSNVVMRSECYRAGVRFDENLSTAADQDFHIQLARAYSARRIAEPLWSYRVLHNSMSRQSIALMEVDHIRVYEKARRGGLFTTRAFERRCFSRLYWILGCSWWVNGNNRWRGAWFLSRSLWLDPWRASVGIVGKMLSLILASTGLHRVAPGVEQD